MLNDTRMTNFLIVQIWIHGSQHHAAVAENKCGNEKCVTRENIWTVVLMDYL